MLLGASVGEFCENTASIWGLLGQVVLILKIVIPLVLIVLGMIDLGKAVIASDDKAISKSVNQLLHRFIAAVVVFFVPVIVSAIFNAIAGINMNNDSWNQCVQCLTAQPNPGVNCTSKINPTSGVE